MFDKAMETRILEILEEELKTYIEILTFSKEKRQILVEGKAAELDRIVRAEQKLSAQVVKFEKERDTILMDGIARGLLTKEELIISKLSEKMSGTAGKRALELGMELTKVLEELKSVNDVNGDLIKQSLDYIEYTVNIMSSNGMATNLTYGGAAPGVDPKKPAGKKTFFDSKV